MAVSSSSTIGYSSTSHPISRAYAPSTYAFASRILPGSGFAGGLTSSVPMLMTPTLGRAYTGMTVLPVLASKPTVAARITSPARTTTSPALASSPALRTLVLVTGAQIRTRSPTPPSPVKVVSSILTTASAPSGMIPPVMMRIAWPGASVTWLTMPAPTQSTISSSTGTSSLAPSREEETTANPSIAVLSKGDTSMSLVRSAAATRPTAANRSTFSTGILKRAWLASSIVLRRASSTLIMSWLIFIILSKG